MNNNLRNSEKFLKSCWKKKVTITLGTVIVFLMTGCGSSGGGSSSSSNIVSGGTSSSQPAVPTPKPPVDVVPGDKPGVDNPEKPTVPSEPSNPGVGGDGSVQPPVEKPNQPVTDEPVKTFKDGTKIYKEKDGSYSITSNNSKYWRVTFKENDKGQFVFTKRENEKPIISEYTLISSPESKDLVFDVKAKYDEGKEKVLANGMKISTITSQVDENNKLVGNKSVTITTTDGKTLTFSNGSKNGITISNDKGESLKLVKSVAEKGNNENLFDIESATEVFKVLNGATIDFTNVKMPVISKDGINYTVGENKYTGETVLADANGNTVIWECDANGKSNGKFTITGKNKNKDDKQEYITLVKDSKTGNYNIVDNEFEAIKNAGLVTVSYNKVDKTFTVTNNFGTVATLKQITTADGKVGYEVVHVENGKGDDLNGITNGTILGVSGNIIPSTGKPTKPALEEAIAKEFKEKGVTITKDSNNSYTLESTTNKNYAGYNITVTDSSEINFTKNNSITDITYTINKDILENAKKGENLEFNVNVVFDNTKTKSDDRPKLANGMIVDSVDATVSTSNILVDGSSSVNLKPVENITANINGGKKLVFSDITNNGATIGNITIGNGTNSVKLTNTTSTSGKQYTMSSGTGDFAKLNDATISKKGENLVITQNGTDYTVGNGVYTGEKVLEAANGNKATWTYDANGNIQNNGEFTIIDKSNKTFKLAKIENNEFLISGISNVSKVTYDSSNSTFTLFDSVEPSSSVTLKIDTKNILEGKITYEVTERVGSNKLISDTVKYIIVDKKTGDFQLVSELPSHSSNNGYTEIAKNTYAKKVEGLKDNTNVYMINKDGKNYIYNEELALEKTRRNQADIYVDLSAIQDAINVKEGTTNVTAIVNAIKTKNIQGIKYPVQSETNSNGQIAQKVDNSSDKNTQQLGNLVNINKLEINGTNISNTQQPASKEITNYAIGQMLKETGGVNAFNFGVIDVKSTNGVAIGQVSDSGTLSSVNGMGLYNLGLIKVAANGKQSIITNNRDGRKYTINGAGMYVQSIETPVFGYNLGTIAIDNTNNNSEYKSVGMVADGKGARVYNFGTIEVTGNSLTGATNGTLNITNDNTFLMGVNGGQAFNYGTLKANGENLTVSGTVNSSTTAKYVSDKKVVIGDTLNVLAEAGKGDSYTVEGYITAKAGVEGLDKVTSNGVYSVSTVENTDKDGNKVVDLQLNKTKKLEQTATGDTAQMISNLGLDQYIYSTNKGKYAGELQGMISANGGNADVLKPLFGFEYANLNGVILNSARDFMDNTNAVIANKGAYVSGDFNRNFEGMATFDKTGTKVGVFKKYREKANENAGMDYTRDSIVVVANQKITDNFSLNLGYENEKDKYEGDSKLESNRGMLGFNFNYDFGQGISYNLLANGTYGKSQMTRNGVKDGKFNTYTVGMENSITKAFEVEYLNESAVTLGIRTIGFGHDKIDLKNSIDAPESVKKNFNVSNAAVVKVKAGKAFEITEKHKLNITTEVKYEKELMNTDDWKDNLKFDTLSGDFVGAPVADDKAGKVSAKVQVGVEVADGYSVGAYFKADTLGYREGGVQVTYKF